MTTDDERKQEKRNRLARRKPDSKPVSAAFIKPSALEEPQAIWNVRLPQSLNARMRQALLERSVELGHRVTARQVTIEAFEKWLEEQK